MKPGLETEIRVGDILKVYHFNQRKRVWYMWKLVSYHEDFGLVGLHTGVGKICKDERSNAFRLHAIADDRGILTHSEIINRDVCFFDRERKRKKIDLTTLPL